MFTYTHECTYIYIHIYIRIHAHTACRQFAVRNSCLSITIFFSVLYFPKTISLLLANLGFATFWNINPIPTLQPLPKHRRTFTVHL